MSRTYAARAILAATAFSLALGAEATHVRAAEPAPLPSLVVSASPIFGPDAVGDGWTEIVARIENPGPSPKRGEVSLRAASPGEGRDEAATRAPFFAPPGHTTVVTLPARRLADTYSQAAVRADDENGVELGRAALSVNAASGPVLIEMDVPARLAPILRGWSVPATWNPGARSLGYASSALAVGSPGVDRASGEPLLPTDPAGYQAATVVLARSSTLAALSDARRAALLDWVVTGGTLAVIPNRPEDLHAEWMTALAGASVRPAPPPARLLTLPVLERPSEAPSIGNTESPSGGEDEATEGAEAGAPPAGGAPTYEGPGRRGPHVAHSVVRVGPLPAVRGKLTGYQGGTLEASDFGASTGHGAGEFHLLAFDPTAAPGIDDAWVHSRLVAMVARAWDRRSTSAFPLGDGERDAERLNEVRRLLDPNENYRIGLAVVAGLLVVYAFASGPFVFARAAKLGRPLYPLLAAPVLAASAFAAILVVGLASKGWRGRARHLALYEVQGGASRASVRRFRGLFASQSHPLQVTAMPGGVTLDVVKTEGGVLVDGTLHQDSGGLSLSGLAGLPWQTLVVREDGIEDLGTGVSLLPDGAAGGFVVVNGSGHPLVDVFAHAPHGGDFVYFASIPTAGRVSLASGRSFGAGAVPPPMTAGALPVHPLSARNLGTMLGGKEGDRLARSWGALEDAAGTAVDWWPDEAPALLAELGDVAPAPRDAGLRVERSQAFVRCVGSRAAASPRHL